MAKRGVQDLWNKYWRGEMDSSKLKEYVASIFATHVISDDVMRQLVQQAISGYTSAVAENRNTLMLQVESVIAPLVNSYGKEALEAVAKHPALAENAMEAFGKHGAALANQLDNVTLVRTLRVKDDLLQLAPTQQRSVLDKIAKMPEVVLDYLKKHPRVLYTATGVATVLSLGHHALEADGDAVRPGGTREPSSPMDRFGQGFWDTVQHVVDKRWQHIGPAAGYICMAGGGVIVLWMASRLALNVRSAIRKRNPP